MTTTVTFGGNPGPKGDPGQGAFSTLTNAFVQPLEGNADATLEDATWLTEGQYVYISGAAIYRVASVTGRVAAITPVDGTLEIDRGELVPAASKVVAAGSPGPVGPAPSGTGLVYVASGTPEAVTIGTGLTLSGSGPKVLAAAGSVYPEPDASTLLRWQLDGAGPFPSDGTNTLAMVAAAGVYPEAMGVGGDGIYTATPGSLSTGNTSVEPTAGALTFSAWINPNSIATNYGVILEKSYRNDGSWNPPFAALYLSLGTGTDWMPGMCVGGVLCQSTVNTPRHLVRANVWQLLAGTYDGTAIRWYYNGELAAIYPVSGTIDFGTHGPYVIGNALGSSGQFFDGRISDIRVESTVRSVAYLKALYRAGVGIAQ